MTSKGEEFLLKGENEKEMTEWLFVFSTIVSCLYAPQVILMEGDIYSTGVTRSVWTK